MKPKLRVIQGGKSGKPKPAEVDGADFTRKLLIERDGPHCAAWLAKKHHAALRRKGYFVVKIPRGVALPMWFSVALGCFQKRSSRWEVEEAITKTATGNNPDRYFTIRWRRFHHFTPAHAVN